VLFEQGNLFAALFGNFLPMKALLGDSSDGNVLLHNFSPVVFAQKPFSWGKWFPPHPDLIPEKLRIFSA